MDDLLCPGDARNNGFRPWPLIVLLQIFGICWHRTAYATTRQAIAITKPQIPNFASQLA